MNRFYVVAGALVAVGAVAFLRAAPAPPPAIVERAVPSARRAHRRAPNQLQTRTLTLYVVGAVRRPGLYQVPAGSRLDRAVRLAGGFLPQADPAAVNLAQFAQDGEEVDALRIGERQGTAPRRGVRTRKSRRAIDPPASPIDLNQADAVALESLPGVGPTLAARIVAYRRVNGAFTSVDELADVAGMTQRRVDAVAPFLTVTAMRE